MDKNDIKRLTATAKSNGNYLGYGKTAAVPSSVGTNVVKLAETEGKLRTQTNSLTGKNKLNRIEM